MTLLAAVVTFALGIAAEAAAAPAIHSHRGGSVLAGVPTFAEETMPAFRHAWERERSVLELDVKLTKDRVPVVIHDDTLDRTTTCEGAVNEKTVAQFLQCRADVLGSGSRTAPSAPGVTLPLLSDVLRYARESGATLNLEIKNLPNDNDFDQSSAYADTVMDAVLASGLRREQLIVQSFWPPNLDAARVKMPGVALSFLTLAQANEGGIEFARARGYQWVSPSGVPSASYVGRAHAANLKVVPYTLNEPDQVKAAADAGVDAVITDDPVMARRALGLPEPPAPPETPLQPPSHDTDRPRTVSGLSGRASMTRRGRFVRVRITLSSPATVSLRFSRAGRTLTRRTLRRRAGTSTFRLRFARRRRAITLSGFAITAAGDVARLRARTR